MGLVGFGELAGFAADDGDQARPDAYACGSTRSTSPVSTSSRRSGSRRGSELGNSCTARWV
eukprot:13659965-Heterocapsa_arctica.AAC.1